MTDDEALPLLQKVNRQVNALKGRLQRVRNLCTLGVSSLDGVGRGGLLWLEAGKIAGLSLLELGREL